MGVFICIFCASFQRCSSAEGWFLNSCISLEKHSNCWWTLLGKVQSEAARQMIILWIFSDIGKRLSSVLEMTSSSLKGQGQGLASSSSWIPEQGFPFLFFLLQEVPFLHIHHYSSHVPAVLFECSLFVIRFSKQFLSLYLSRTPCQALRTEGCLRCGSVPSENLSLWKRRWTCKLTVVYMVSKMSQ